MSEQKQKSQRNKTLDAPLEEEKVFFDKCISVENKVNFEEIKNKTICGDTLKVLENLPEKELYADVDVEIFTKILSNLLNNLFDFVIRNLIFGRIGFFKVS